jgi:branched-subunit amino acid aminotransferase/4-amino-4-deoxychorismate lyase
MILDICLQNDIPAEERNISLTELYTADEVFTSGTMGELTPVLEADGRQIADGRVGDMTRRLQSLHRTFAFEHGTALPGKVSRS